NTSSVLRQQHRGDRSMKGKASFDAMWALRQLDAIEYLYTETNLSAEARDSMRREVLNKLEEVQGAKLFERPFLLNLRTELDQNGACAPSRMSPPNRQLFWIATSMKRRARFLLAPASAAHSAAGRPVRKTSDLAHGAMGGTLSTLGECARRASTNGA